MTKENLLKTLAIVSLANFQILLRHPRLAFDWLFVSFFVSKIPREVCSAPPTHIFQCSKLPDFWPVVCALFCIFIFGILHQILNLKGCYLLLTFPPFCFGALSWLSWQSNYFRLSTLNFSLLSSILTLRTVWY